MLINCTFFIQILNFFCTYWFCRRFFFDPVLKIVLHKKQEKLATETECAQIKQKLAELEHEKKKILIQFQELSNKKNTELLIKKQIPWTEPLIKPIDIPNESELIETCASIIKTKVLHDQ